MRKKQRTQNQFQHTESPDFYEAAYQKIWNKIALKNPGIRTSELRRMTMVEIRQRLKLHIPLEDIDIYNFRAWPAKKRLKWLYDLQMFVSKTLGKKAIRELRGF